MADLHGLPIVPFTDGEVAAESPEPQRIYLSNPDWALDDRGPLLLYDNFGGELAVHRINLLRRGPEGWREVASFPESMHSHLIHLPERPLWLVLGVRQTDMAICLWSSRDGERWSEPRLVVSGEPFHAGSTPWAVYQGRLFVPFEHELKGAGWGSYSIGCLHASLDSDLTDPASYTPCFARAPWSLLPGRECNGTLEGNLIVAPDGRLYNLARMTDQARLARWRWDDGRGQWEWLGIVQGLHNQSKPEVFTDRQTGRVYLLANGWPARMVGADRPDWRPPTGWPAWGARSTLCLWEAAEPDLSRWRFVRTVIGSRDTRCAFSYVAALLEETDDGLGRLWIAERNADDRAHNYHDTNRLVVRRIDGFREWAARPALCAFSHDGSGQWPWRKEQPLDGLLISHLDRVRYPMRLSARLRIADLEPDGPPLELLGFATCDLTVLAAFRLVAPGGPHLTLWSGGEEFALARVRPGQDLDLALELLSETEVRCRVDGEVVRCRPQGHSRPTSRPPLHVPSHPSLAGILPRDQYVGRRAGAIEVVEGPGLTFGSRRPRPAPVIPGARLIIDGAGLVPYVGHAKYLRPVHANRVPDGPGVLGGLSVCREPYTGRLVAGADQPCAVAALPGEPSAWTTGGFAQVSGASSTPSLLAGLSTGDDPQALGQVRLAVGVVDRDGPCLALLLPDADGSLLAVPADSPLPQLHDGESARFFFALSVSEETGGRRVTLFQGRPGQQPETVLARPVPDAAPGPARWVALNADGSTRVTSAGGLFYAETPPEREALAPLCQAGFLSLHDCWPQ